MFGHNIARTITVIKNITTNVSNTKNGMRDLSDISKRSMMAS